MVVVLVATLIYARRQVSEAQALRQEQSRPHVVPSIDIEQEQMLVLAVENIGRTTAHDVRIQFDEGPFSTIGDIETAQFLREPIPTMPPGHRYRVNWELGFKVFEDDYPHPRTYGVTVSFSDALGRPLEPERYVLDFGVYQGQATGEPGIPEIARTLKEIQRELKR